jgi:hypothetical protein
MKRFRVAPAACLARIIAGIGANLLSLWLATLIFPRPESAVPLDGPAENLAWLVSLPLATSPIAHAVAIAMIILAAPLWVLADPAGERGRVQQRVQL